MATTSMDEKDTTRATTATAPAATSGSNSSAPHHPLFHIGQHIYRWSTTWAGLPGLSAQHAIVVDIVHVLQKDNDGIPPTEEEQSVSLVVAQFERHTDTCADDDEEQGTLLEQSSWWLPQEENKGDDDDDDGTTNPDNNINDKSDDMPASTTTTRPSTANVDHTQPKKPATPPRSSLRQSGRIRVFTVTETQHWHPVQYGVTSTWQLQTRRAGTVTRQTANAPALIRARLQFMLQQQQPPEISSSSGSAANNNNCLLLPPYHSIYANDECWAVWVTTGTWATLQATTWLTTLTAGQVKSTATLAGVATTATVTQPAAGIWGSWFGYTTTTPLLSAQPWIAPALVAYGVVTVGVPVVGWTLARRAWQRTTTRLNDAFWQNAMDHPANFATNVMNWSAVPPEKEEDGVAPSDSHAVEVIRIHKDDQVNANVSSTTDASNANVPNNTTSQSLKALSAGVPELRPSPAMEKDGDTNNMLTPLEQQPACEQSTQG